MNLLFGAGIWLLILQASFSSKVFDLIQVLWCAFLQVLHLYLSATFTVGFCRPSYLGLGKPP
jgi:hypothetical protein